MSPVTPADSAARDAAPVRLGVLGCADIAARRMVPAAVASSSVTVTAVASRTASRARDLAATCGAAPVEGYDALLRRDDVDAVYVPVPAALHAEWIRSALAAGKHVLAEKPVTTDAATTAELVALARRRGLVLRENVLFVHHRQHAEVLRRVAAGEIGTLRALRSGFAVPRRPDGDIRLRPELGGGALLDTGVYPIRLAHRFLGRSLRVAGAALHRDPALGVELSGAALLVNDDGVTAEVSFGLDHAYTSFYELTGSRGTFRLEHAFTTPPDHTPTLHTNVDGRREQIALPADDQCVAALASFARAVRAGTTDISEYTENTEHTAASCDVARLLDDVRGDVAGLRSGNRLQEARA